MTITNILHQIQNGVSRTRRNHALEHATLQILSTRFPHKSFAGYADIQGIRILGDVSIKEIHIALEEALQRLRSGEYNLAIHPFCGTNYVIGGGLAALAGALVMQKQTKGFFSWLEKASFAVLLGTLSLMLAQPIGMFIQKSITTSPNPMGLEIDSVTFKEVPRWGKMIRIITHS